LYSSRDGAPSQGQTFDVFELIRPLGSGGMATVHLARDTSLDRLVAIKFIATKFSDPNARDRLRREAKAIARLQHPNVVAIYRIGELAGQPYIAYEYVAGRQLDELPRPVDWMQVLRIALGLSRGLAAAHHRGIIHRGLIPRRGSRPEFSAPSISYGNTRWQDAEATLGAAASDRPVSTTGGALGTLGEGDYDYFRSPSGVKASVTVRWDEPEWTVEFRGPSAPDFEKDA